MPNDPARPLLALVSGDGARPPVNHSQRKRDHRTSGTAASRHERGVFRHALRGEREVVISVYNGDGVRIMRATVPEWVNQDAALECARQFLATHEEVRSTPDRLLRGDADA